MLNIFNHKKLFPPKTQCLQKSKERLGNSPNSKRKGGREKGRKRKRGMDDISREAQEL